MIKSIDLDGRKIEYELQWKNVKNINLRIRGDGRVYVSANNFTRIETIENFIRSKQKQIVKAIDSCNAKGESKEYFSEEELKEEILSLCELIYPYYEARGIKKPQIQFKKLVSVWGSCNYIKGIIKFSTNLKFTSFECVRYVVCHEFTHLIVPNHSKAFYKELENVCPDWKECRKKLKETSVEI